MKKVLSTLSRSWIDENVDEIEAGMMKAFLPK